MTENELLATVEGAIKQAEYHTHNGLVAPEHEQALKETGASIDAKINTLKEAKDKIENFFMGVDHDKSPYA